MNDKLPAQEARQGRLGRPVLLGSLAGLAAALFGLVTWQGATAPKDYASLSQDSARRTVLGSEADRGSEPSSGEAARVPGGNPSDPQPSARNPN